MLPYASVILAILIVTSLLVIWSWIVKTRSMATRDDSALSNDMTDFREMHEQGALDDEEFTRLKKIISNQSGSIRKKEEK